MSKTNATPTPANQSASASNDVPASAASSKPAFNYAAAAARSASSNRPGSGPLITNAAAPPSTPSSTSFASAVGSVPPPPSNLPVSSIKPQPGPIDVSPSVPRPINGSTAASTAAKAPAPVSDSRRTSVVGIKAHNVKPSAASHIAFGSLADLPAKSDTAAAILSSSPANPPTLSRRDGPPVFGSVPTDPARKLDKSPVAVTSVAPSATTTGTTAASATVKPTTTATAPAVQPPAKTEKKKYDFQSFFRAGGETASQPPPPASTGSSPSPSMSYRPDPTQNRRTNTFDSSNAPHPHPVSPRPGHLAVPNGAGPNSFHSPLSGASRTFTPGGQGQPVHTQPPPPQSQPPSHQYGPNQPHWQGGGQAPNSPHFVPGGPPHNNMPNYPHANGAGPNNQNQYLQKPQAFGHRNGPGVAQSNAPSFPPNGRPNMHHQQRAGTGGPAPPSPRLPSAGAPNNGAQNAPYPPGSNGPAYWPQGPYPPGAPAPYSPYGYNPNSMPTYPHSASFPPPPPPPPSHAPQQQQQQPQQQPGPPPPQLPTGLPRTQPNLPVPTSPAPTNTSFQGPGYSYSPGGGSHSRGPSLSYNAPPFNPSVVSPEFKPRTPNAGAAVFQPRKSAALEIKKPSMKPVGTSVEGEAEEELIKKDGAVVTKKMKTEEEATAKDKAEAEKKELEKKAADELAAEKKRAEEEKQEKERKARAEAEAKAKAEEEEKRKAKEDERLAREAKEKAEKERVEKEAAAAAAKAKAEAEELAKVKAAELEKEKAAKAEAEKAAAQTQSSAAEKSESEAAKPKAVDEPLIKSVETNLPSRPINGTAAPSSTNNKVRPTPIDVNAIPASKRGDSTMSPALPSALSSARKIEDLGQVSYPENIQSPRPDLNAEAAPGKFRYDRAFLLQFMEVCKGKPTQLPDLDSIGLVESQPGSMMSSMSRTQSASGQRRNPGQLPPSGRGPLTPSGPGSMSGMMGGAGGMPGRAGVGMPMFAAGANRTSEERFSQSNRAILGAMPIGSGLMLPGRPTGQMSRSPSTNALPGMMSNGARDTNRRSGRGSRRDGGPPLSTGPGGGMSRGGMGPGGMQPMFSATTGEVIQPLQSSANSWATARSNTLEEDSPEMVNRKVRALLNKLTLDKFESISDQVIEWANKSEKESDGRILRQVIALIFEKATDEAHWSEMYAKLCRKLMEKLSQQVMDEGVRDTNGNKVHGGHLFRKYLLNRCQEDYERGWSKRDELAAAAAGKAADDAVKQAANEKSRAEAEAAGKEESTKEAEILSDEYYAAQKAKRQGLGLVRFIGELFKLNMLTERIMHECIKKLLSNIENPEEEDIESLCRLMMTVGKMLDHEKAISHMNVYFSRMTTMAQSKNLSSRARFMIQDVVDTRDNHWVGRNVAAGPKLISQIHQEAAQAAAEQSRQAQAKQNMSKNSNDLARGGSRGGRNRGGGSGDQFGNAGPSADGWSSVGGSAPPPRPAKAGDLTHFGKLRDTSSSGRPSFGPSAVFANKGKMKDGKALVAEPLGAAVASNPFAALNADVGESGAVGGTLAKKPSVPEMSGGGRPRLNLAPRTLPLPLPNESASAVEKTEKEPAEKDVDDETAERLVKNRVDEFFHVKSVPECLGSFEGLPRPRHFMLIRALVAKAMEMKSAEVSMTAEVFEKLKEGSVVSKDGFRKAFEPVIELLDDTAVDAPAAYNYCGKLLAAAGFAKEEVKEMGKKIDAGDDAEAAGKRLVDAFVAALPK
ncbi:hypothetical protein CROQUDRAFT_133344 [Cronartium quercuum f. sp. fusiforme G11]|uniref:MI domain-containing protein n=1 Tax=Cronartium quercuum f. sp. fusiforme G11 TaxID=708437 RepID=A0A9P6NM46_9BASI|nr:hypothetical protein CROQUDRAFT_133344 [Cronartium quercuum f. sp. fusiforme G11]